MKKLLFIFSLAAICAVITSSFRPVQSANDVMNSSITVSSVQDIDSPEDVKKDTKKQKQATTSGCCQQKAEKPECTEKQQKSCEASKAECPAAQKNKKK